jgi:ABC-type amino acid transport substrate-binding protein
MFLRAGLRIFCLAFIAAFPVSASAQNASPSQELTVGVKEAPPFTMKSGGGEWSGLSVELWQKIAHDLNLKYRFVEAPTVQELLNMAATKKSMSASALLR